MKKETKFAKECREQREYSGLRFEARCKLEIELKAKFGADAVYLNDRTNTASVWFTGKKQGARFFPNRNESLLVVNL